MDKAAGTVLPSRRAIAEVTYEGDRPDVPPLEERGNAQFTAASFDDTGTLLVTQAWFGSTRMQVWDVASGALVSGFDAIVPNPSSRPIWIFDGSNRRGVAMWDTATDTIRFPLRDPKRKPLPYPMQQ